jgi:DNA-binding HxlR family transcriptional regulator
MERDRCGCRSTGTPSADGAGTTCLCPVDDLLDVVSREYALAIVGLLANDGPRRHSEIADALAVSSSSVLSARLRELSEIGLLDRTSYDTVPPRVEYSLTADGREFVRRLRPLLEWIRGDDRSSG